MTQSVPRAAEALSRTPAYQSCFASPTWLGSDSRAGRQMCLESPVSSRQRSAPRGRTRDRPNEQAIALEAAGSDAAEEPVL